MRRFLPVVLLLGSGFALNAEEEWAPRAQPWVSPCEILCANLIQAIQARPDLMVMRLEDALVINEPCTAEIVTAAIDAVSAKPALVQQIIETALKVAPARSSLVMSAVASYTPAQERIVVQEEVRRAEVPPPEPLIEIRRAEVADTVASPPIEEIRRAVVAPLVAAPAAPPIAEPIPELDNTPHEEIRRAEIILMAPPPKQKLK